MLAVIHKNTPNFWPGRQEQAGAPKYNPRAFVIHRAQGYEAGVSSWFANPASEVSAHYLVCVNGQVYQYVDDGDAAWGNGFTTKDAMDLTVPIINYWHANGINPNLETISIEHEGFYPTQLSGAQFQSSCELVQSLCARFQIPYDRQHILGHYQIDNVQRPNCPGFTDAEWQRYIDGIQPVIMQKVMTVTMKADWFDPATKVPVSGVFVDYWLANGGIDHLGHPLAPGAKESDGVYRQLFENVLLEYYQNGNITRLGGLGQRWARALENGYKQPS